MRIPLLLAFLAPSFTPLVADASSLIVPDDTPSIQSAIDSRPDTVFVRSGVYSESPELYAEVAVIGLSSEGSDAPIVGGLRIEPLWVPKVHISIYTENIAFSGPVYIQNDNMLSVISFVSCRMAAGITDISAYPATIGYLLRRCSIAGRTFLKADGDCVIDSCTFSDEFVAGEGHCHLQIANSVFRGKGSGFGITTIGAGSDVASARVSDTLVEGYSGAIILNATFVIQLERNIVRDCVGRGIHANSDRVTAIGNRVQKCGGYGLVAAASESLVVARNTVEGCGLAGIVSVPGAYGEVSNNIVWANRLDGIQLSADAHTYGLLVKNNTSVLNQGSGFLSQCSINATGRYEFAGNVGIDNSRYGVDWDVPEVSSVRCNNWFDNHDGATRGLSLSPDDAEVDPMFCGADRGDFGLLGESPLLDMTYCGQIGALGPGCADTVIQVRSFLAERVQDGVNVTWELALAPSTALVWVERSENGTEGPWVRQEAERSGGGQTFQEHDRSALPDRVYWYRLISFDAGATEVISQPISVDVLPGTAFRLVVVGPSPSRGPVRIDFELDRQADIRVEVYDVQGRLIATPARGSWNAGRHSVQWTGVNGSSRVPGGLYLVRYRFPGGEEGRRIVFAP